MTYFEFLICTIREPTFFGIAESKKLRFVFMSSSWLTRRPKYQYLLIALFSILEKCPDNFGLNLGKPTNICLSFSHQTTRYEQKRLILYSIFITVEKINQPYCCGKDMKERGCYSSKSGKIVRFQPCFIDTYIHNLLSRWIEMLIYGFGFAKKL